MRLVVGDDKGKQGRRGASRSGGNGGGSRENIFALSSRARSYYWHTWCNILPLIFASVRGFLLWPRRDFTSAHTVRDATGGSSPGRHEREEGGERGARMIECYRSSQRVARTRERERETPSIPRVTKFRARSLAREKFARRGRRRPDARSHSWLPRASVPRVSHCLCRISSIRVSQ